MNVKTALFKLAFFEPNLSDEKDNQILDYLVLECITAHSPMLECNSAEVAKYIKTTFSIEFEEAEILSSAERLQEKENIIIIESAKKYVSPRFKLMKADSDINQNKIVELEERVFGDWSDYLIKKYEKFVTESNVEKLVQSFQTFLSKMLVLHGKESVATLYPDNPKTQKWLDKINGEIIKELPKLGKELDIIQQIEIPLFFKSDEKNRKDYLNNLFNASFLWHLIQIDDACTEYFKKTIEGQILVLDNNILFSLIGLHGTELLNAVHNLMNYATELGYELIVTTKTLDEFYNSIQKNTEKALKSPLYSKEIALAAIDVLETNTFLVSYWKEFINNGLAIEEFALEKSHINNILKGYGIKLTEQFREEIEKSEELKDEESLLRESCSTGNFSQSVIEHDAFHRIFIKKLRNGFKYKFSEAKAWFLTHDSKLPTYAHHALKGRRALPFCISTNEWMQVNRPFLKRNNSEYEKSFQVLVTQPFLRTALSNFKVDKVKEKLLSKLNRYNNMDTQLAFDLTTDVHFLYSLSKEKNDEKVEEKIDNAILEINQNLRDENKDVYEILEKQEIENQEKINNLNVDLEKIRSELTEKEELHNNLLAELSKLKGSLDNMSQKIDKRDEEITTSKKELDDKNKEIETISKTARTQKAIIIWGLFAVLLISGSLIIWFMEKLFDWQWFTVHSYNLAMKIILNIELVLITLNIPLSKHWVIWISAIGAFLIAFLTFAFG
ncbi:hypothetical protein [Maribellus maritimus]|uniref:hypothetical protein n=1 Tax=Maribellus maritimus TaxID=2870838 RepID=UPI001EECC609|nr:hypothetical protein [Maribellus maritimus]MCG6190078.1 hypothetical protein [Maribellus maritimus]